MPDKVKGMTPQGLSNSLCAVARLHESAPQVLEALPALVLRQQETIGAMNLRDLSDNFWAAGKLKAVSREVEGLATQLIGRIRPAVTLGSSVVWGGRVGGQVASRDRPSAAPAAMFLPVASPAYKNFGLL